MVAENVAAKNCSVAKMLIQFLVAKKKVTSCLSSKKFLAQNCKHKIYIQILENKMLPAVLLAQNVLFEFGSKKVGLKLGGGNLLVQVLVMDSNLGLTATKIKFH